MPYFSRSRTDSRIHIWLPLYFKCVKAYNSDSMAFSVNLRPLQLKHKSWLRGVLTNNNTLKMIWKVAACVIWAEWFVSLSWSENAHKVTNASVNLATTIWKRAIMSQTRSMNQKCSYKLNHEKNLIKMWERGFLTESWISTL